MLSSSTCKDDTFSTWLARHAKIGEQRSAALTSNSFWDLLKPGIYSKPVLVFFDEIQTLYNVDYAVSFWETIKCIYEDPKNWNVKVHASL